MRRFIPVLAIISLQFMSSCAVQPAVPSSSFEPPPAAEKANLLPTVTPESDITLPPLTAETARDVEAHSEEEAVPALVEWNRIPSGSVTIGSSSDQSEAALLACQEAQGDCSEANFQRETPQETVFVDQFEITETEVSNRQYAACVEAGVCHAPRTELDEELIPYRSEFSSPERPVVGVSATDASIYCREWLGGRLPSRAEWERAARGDDARSYPWGNVFEAGTANLAGSGPAPVKSFAEGASPFGVQQMSGNVWEWTDQDVRSAGNMSPSIVVRGGGWTSRPYEGRIAYLGESLSPSTARYDIGIRCVRDAASGTSVVEQTEPIGIELSHVGNTLLWAVTHAAAAQVTCYSVLGRAITGSWAVEIGSEGTAPVPDESVTCNLTATGYDGSTESAVVVLGQRPPKCDIDPAPAFASTVEQYAASLGCARAQAIPIPMIAEEPFQGGYMVWRSDTDAVTVIYTPSGQWQSDPGWAWDGSDPEGVGLDAPDGLYEPVRGFGWLWRTHLGAEMGELGWATAPELGHENIAEAQEFDGGLLLSGSDSKVFVLLDKDRRQ